MKTWTLKIFRTDVGKHVFVYNMFVISYAVKSYSVSVVNQKQKQVTVSEMGRRGKNSTFQMRQLVIFHHAKGKTCREIADLLNMKKSTVSDICRFRYEDRIENLPQSGRPKVLNRKETAIVRKMKKHSLITATKIANEVEEELSKKINPSMVRRVFRANYHGRTRR